MSEQRWQQVKQLVGEALELPSAQRAAHVQAACAGDAANFVMKAFMPSLPGAAGRCAGVGALRLSRGNSVVSAVKDSVSSVE